MTEPQDRTEQELVTRCLPILEARGTMSCWAIINLLPVKDRPHSSEAFRALAKDPRVEGVYGLGPTLFRIRT